MIRLIIMSIFIRYLNLAEEVFVEAPAAPAVPVLPEPVRVFEEPTPVYSPRKHSNFSN